MVGTAVFRMVVSSDYMKKATATSHGNNRFTDSPEGVLGAVLVLELAGIILGTNSIAGLRILANDTVGICFPSVDISTGGGQPERHSVVIVGKSSIRPQSLPKDRGKFFCVRRLIEKFFRFKLPLVQQPRQLETLDDLLAQAAHYADFCMVQQREDGPHAFPDWRGRADDVRPGFVGG